jgi:peptidoglycan/xylan/chitin deacetylase (PgdA/CDA1 family)
MMTYRLSLRIGAVAVLVSAWSATAGLQQQPAPANTPAFRFNEEQIRAAVPVRVGRKLLTRGWPNGAKVAVCLTFEVNAEASGITANELLPVPLSAQEFGVIKGLPRVLDVLDRHNVPATFFFAAVNASLHPEAVAQVKKSGRHEIALNGWMHENLAELNDEAQEQRLLDDSLATLTRIAGKRPVGWRAPSWTFSRHTLGRLQKAGFLYDSTLMGRDEPYEINAYGAPTGVVELPLNAILNDEPYFTTTRSFPAPEMIFKVYQDEFDVAYREGTMLMLTLHPHVSGHRSRIMYLDRLLEYMKSKPGVWFATAEQVANHVKPTVATRR